MYFFTNYHILSCILNKKINIHASTTMKKTYTVLSGSPPRAHKYFTIQVSISSCFIKCVLVFFIPATAIVP